jgi:hypothetical protein
MTCDEPDIRRFSAPSGLFRRALHTTRLDRLWNSWLELPRWLKAVVLITVFASGMRLVGLETSPPGYFYDEAAESAQIICMRQSGADLHGKQLPLFTEVLGGGLLTPVNLYVGTAWSAVFGDSIAAFRSMTAFIGIMTVVGVFALALGLWRSREAAWLCALCAAISPWGFIFSRIFWDAPLGPCLLVWGLAGPLHGDKNPRWVSAVSGLLVALACYSYPPTRLQVALFLPVYVGFIFFYRRECRASLTPFAASLCICLIPLVQQTLSGALHVRVNALTIWNADFLGQFGGFSVPVVARVFLENMALNLSPRFLFWTGDANLRHSTHFSGQWGWLEIVAVFGGILLLLTRITRIKHEEAAPVMLVIAGYLTAVVPAALTWDANPHALRSIGAYPFLALGAGYALMQLTRWKQPLRTVVPVIGAAFVIAYGWDFFAYFPERSAGPFHVRFVERARQADSASIPAAIKEIAPHYPDMSIMYFQLRSGSVRCTSK